MTILTKKQMSEEDIKLQYITPAILAKWDKSRITMETKITDGKICLNGNFVHRDKKSAKYADYLLYYNSSFPIAIVEAKDNKHSVSFGLQQAITYAQMIDVPLPMSASIFSPVISLRFGTTAAYPCGNTLHPMMRTE